MDDLIFAPANLGIRQRIVCEALENAGGELSLPALREAVPGLCRQNLWTAVSALEKRDLVDTWYDEDGVKRILYTYRERALEGIRRQMQEASEDDYPGRFDYLPDPEEEPASEDREDDEGEEEMTPEQIREEVRNALSEPRTKTADEVAAEAKRETDEKADLYREQALLLWEGMDPDDPEEYMTPPRNV